MTDSWLGLSLPARRWLRQRDVLAPEIEASDLITKVNVLPDAPGIPLDAYGLASAPDAARGHGKPAEVRLYVDDVPAGYGELPWTVPNLFAIVGVSCGFAAYDTVDPDRFLAPFPFTGDLTHVRLDVSGDLVIDEVAEFRRLMAQQ